jgi:hypothetical protein
MLIEEGEEKGKLHTNFLIDMDLKLKLLDI